MGNCQEELSLQTPAVFLDITLGIYFLLRHGVICFVCRRDLVKNAIAGSFLKCCSFMGTG